MTDKANPTHSIAFCKMQGLGNNYVYITHMPEGITEESLPAFAERISSEGYGLGSDGLVMILPSEKADFRMRIFNRDGSEAEMCGNASRCIGKFVYENGLTDKKHFTLETLGGIKVLDLTVEDGKVVSVTVDMGVPKIDAALSLEKDGVAREFIPVNVGNPHGVTFVEALSDELLKVEGPYYEVHKAFPNKANIEFVVVKDANNVDMRVWERGSGETMACGTGACATAAACIHTGRTSNNVNVHLLGGVLNIRLDEKNGHLFMTGPAAYIAKGEYYY